MSIEAMKQALEVLEQINQLSVGENAIALPGEIDAAMDDLRAAIEQPEQGQWDAIPDAFNEWWNADYDDSTNPFRLNSPAYWAWSGWSAANKEWVGLTDEEINEFIGPWGDTPIRGYTRKLFDQIEAKLKEKNR
jgi:hypothetical protein